MTHPFLMRAAAAIALTALLFSAPTAMRVAAQGDANQLVPPNAFKDLKWRSVGATRGGRVTAYSGVRQQPYTFYFGGVGGGVWKTDDAGITWAPVSDGQITSTGSIGSIDVAPSNPNHVWVGTGSAAIRSNVIIGRGVYRSGDAEALAARLNALLASKSMMEKAKAAALQAAEQGFCWERQKGRLLDAVARALAAPARTARAR